MSNWKEENNDELKKESENTSEDTPMQPSTNIYLDDLNETSNSSVEDFTNKSDEETPTVDLIGESNDETPTVNLFGKSNEELAVDEIIEASTVELDDDISEIHIDKSKNENSEVSADVATVDLQDEPVEASANALTEVESEGFSETQAAEDTEKSVNTEESQETYEKIFYPKIENEEFHESYYISPPTPSPNRSKWLKITGIALLIISCINSYFLFKKDSVVERAYFINHYEQQYAADYEQQLSKDGVISSKETVIISEVATNLDAISAREGQTIEASDVLAQYNEEAKEEKMQKLQNDLNAYEKELAELNAALSRIESQTYDYSPQTYIDADQLAGFAESGILQFDISQYYTFNQASSILTSSIAAVNRQIEITQSSINQLDVNRSLISPINGVIKKIETNGGNILFHIESTDKNIAVYIDEAEWQNVNIGQVAYVQVSGNDNLLEGIVTEKQQLPAKDSIWQQRLQNEGIINENDTVYEVRIDIQDSLENVPLSALSNAKIIVLNAGSSYISPSSWIVDKKIENVGDHHHYAIGYDGKIRLQPVEIVGEASLTDIKPMKQKDEKTGELKNTSIYSKPQLNSLKEQMENSDEQATIYHLNSDDPVLLIDNKERRIFSNTFFPLPLKKIDFDAISDITWKQIVKYMFY